MVNAFTTNKRYPEVKWWDRVRIVAAVYYKSRVLYERCVP